MSEKITDRQFLRAVLEDGRPHNLNEILRRSFAERNCGLTVHSRAAELRAEVQAQGGDLLNWKNGQRGDGSWYQLLLNAPAGDPKGSRRAVPLLSQDDGVSAGALSGSQVGHSAASSTADHLPGELEPGAAQLTLEVAA